MVAAGDLPPVEERLPLSPYVVDTDSLVVGFEPDIGVYGGMMRLPQEGPGGDPHIYIGMNEPLIWAPGAFEYDLGIHGNVAQDWEVNADGITIPTLEGDHLASPGDWIIRGVKGEFYPCKPDIFEMTYDVNPLGSAPIKASSEFDFSLALLKLKDGRRVARRGWNGKGMWIALSCDGGRETKAENFWSPHAKAHAIASGGTATVLPSVIMKTANGEILMGWLASQTDMLAEDWHVVK